MLLNEEVGEESSEDEEEEEEEKEEEPVLPGKGGQVLSRLRRCRARREGVKGF